MAGARTSRSWAAGRPRRWATTTPAITPDEQAAGDAETPFPHGEVPPVPVMVNDTLDLVELFGVDQGQPAYLQSVFSHDMYVVKVGQRYVMHMSYWDGGYVLLDVTDPRPGQVSLIAESDYALLDEERLLARGQEIAPEGNAHQSELSADRTYLVATDEDFNPFAVTGTIETGPHTGFLYRANSAADTPPIEEGTEISGAPTVVGLGCCTTYPGSVPAGTGVALVERGVCTFQERLDSITAPGYSAGTVVMSTRSKPPSQKQERNLREAPARQPTVRCLDDLPCLDERR